MILVASKKMMKENNVGFLTERLKAALWQLFPVDNAIRMAVECAVTTVGNVNV